MSKREALRFAQYSENTAPSRVENASVKAAFARIVRRAVPAHKLVQRLAEGVDATKTIFIQKNGVVIETRDVVAWGERRKYIQLAAAYGGYIQPDKPDVNVTVPFTLWNGVTKSRYVLALSRLQFGEIPVPGRIKQWLK